MSGNELILITNNQHKIAELKPVFEEYGLKFTTNPYSKVEIRSDEVAEVAEVAAKHAFNELKGLVVVDDTGLYIDSLNGFPKAYAAFVLRTIGIEGILRLMDGIDDRSARFVTAVGFSDGKQIKVFTGVTHGTISLTPSGDSGFGYDPIFIPDGMNKTYAQLSMLEKVSISHRTKAFHAFLEWYVNQYKKQGE